MGLAIEGYVLEPPRVGQANSPFTLTPNVYVSNQGTFDGAYPANESVPRTEYLVQVMTDGDLDVAKFAWTKNEGAVASGLQVPFLRFDYDGQAQRFKLLPGSSPTNVGILGTSSNTTRLKVEPPGLSSLSNFPIRLAVGPLAGIGFIVNTVADDSSFGFPSPGSVQLSLATGNLNWATSDLTTYAGQTVRFQRQNFYSFRESNGKLGPISNQLLLNPLPKSGQVPMIRIGYGEYLTSTEVGSFSGDPLAGHVEWISTTGLLKFNSGDIASNANKPVYYDGVMLAVGLQVPRTSQGTVASPTDLSTLPSEDSDTYFRTNVGIQFAQTVFVDTLNSIGKRGEVQIRRSDGAVQFSAADRASYGSQLVISLVPDIPIERGVAFRLFRTPVDPTAIDATLKDVSASYVGTDLTLANPIIAAPTVFLPAVPVDTEPLTVTVVQGTGTFTGTLLRKDIPSPSDGFGYVLDFDTRQLQFVVRKSNIVIPAPTAYGGAALDPLLLDSNLILELETASNSGSYAALTVGSSALVDLPSGLVTLLQTQGTEVLESTGDILGDQFMDSSVNFISLGILAGDLLIATSGAASGVYTVKTVASSILTLDVVGLTATEVPYQIRRGKEVLLDRFFRDVPPIDPNTIVKRVLPIGVPSNSPCLAIDKSKIDVSEFRLGLVSATKVVVANDGAFSSPSSGSIQVSSSTGNLNFSSADITAAQEVCWIRILTLGVEYSIQPALGFVDLSDRLLQRESVSITYKNADGDIVEENAAFLVRKELTQPHPSLTATLSFNPLGRTLTTTPPPRAFRGGRPQNSAQVSFNTSLSTLTFGTASGTDALPSGPIQPNENVYVDYYVVEAIGGEKSFTVSQFPIQTVQVRIIEGDTTFTITGDRTAEFVTNRILRLNKEETYLIASSSYSSGTTTVTLVSPQTFLSDLSNPKMSVSSGPIRVAGTVEAPSYFIPEVNSYSSIARGSNKIKISGDASRVYLSGTVILMTGSGILDVLMVSGSAYNADSDTTEIVLIANCAKQYSASIATLKRSVRPIAESTATSALTLKAPVSTLPITVFRKVEGSVGIVLESPTDYNLDDSGKISFAEALSLNEELSILYSGVFVASAERKLRASYTAMAVPDASNGLLNQVLKMSYTTYAPDTFFWRVETMTNFRGELVEQYSTDAQSGIPSGGPILSNSASAKLFQQGRESVFFQEGHLANEDIVARSTLKYYNDAVNTLEVALRNMDGRVVGDLDGLFLFDGNVDNPPRTAFSTVSNQIDDHYKISAAPYTVTGPPFVLTSIGTYQEVYKAAQTSRFFPTRKHRFGVTVDPAGLQTGDTILDTGVKNLNGISSVQRRSPWAQTTRLATAGSTTITVDFPHGDSELIRPALNAVASMKMAIDGQNGSALVADGAALTVQSTTSTTVTFTTALLVAIPIGSTIRLATTDTVYRKFYRIGVDIGVNLESGYLTHIKPYPPLDGSVGGIPAELLIQNPAGAEALDVLVSLVNSSTIPERFPALDGLTTDDDGDRSLPVLTPLATAEGGNVGGLGIEQRLIATSTGTLRTATTASFQGTGSLDGTRTIITNSGGAWPSPVPKIYDLVEIRSGLNVNTGFRRITAVGASTITVDGGFPFASVDTGFTYTVTVSNSLAVGSSSGNVSPSTRLTDGAATFTAAGVKIGHTVVITSGSFAGSRRQVVNIVSATALDVEPAFPSTGASLSYRVDNPLGTFGSPSALSIREVQLLPALNVEVSATQNQIDSLVQAFSTVTSAIVVSTGDNTGTVFTDLSVDFQALGVNTSHFLYITSGANATFYSIFSVGVHTLTLIETPPANIVGQGYKVVSTVGVTVGSLKSTYLAYQDSTVARNSSTSFRSLVNTASTVPQDSNAWARRLLSSDLNARETYLTQRNTELTDPTKDVAAIENVMKTGDRLYDKRYSWINSRINLENGILPKKDRAVASRLKAQTEVLNQLIKILSTQV